MDSVPSRGFKILDPLWTVNPVFRIWKFLSYPVLVILCRFCTLKLKNSWKILCQIETLTKQFPQAWDTNMPYRIFFPILFESLTHQMSVSLLCGFCTPKGCLKFWTPFEQCMWFLKIMWKKTILKTKFFLPILECRQKSVQRKIFWSKNSKKLRISWKILCQIETLTKQFPQAWDTNMPYRIFSQSHLSLWHIKCPYPYCAGSVHRKDV